MPKLTDTQTMLLAHASQRENGSLYPLPDTLSGSDRATKAVAALIKAALADERETNDKTATCRTEGGLSYGAFITTSGLAAIGITDAGGAEGTGGEADDTAPTGVALASALTAPRITKANTVLTLLQRDIGATLAELVEATGWLPHTTRAALTGLRKKGHEIERYKRDDVTCYRITAAVKA